MEAQSAFLIVTVAHREWALPLTAIRRVVASPRLLEAPLELLAGFLDLAGELVAVVPLASLLGRTPEPPRLESAIVILEAPQRRLGLLVDHADEIVRESPRSQPESESQPLVAGSIAYRGGSVAVLDPAELLLVEEQERIEELRRQREQRLARLVEEGA